MIQRTILIASLLAGLSAPAAAQTCPTVPGPGCPCTGTHPGISTAQLPCDGTIPDGTNPLVAKLTVPADQCAGAPLVDVNVRVKIIHPSIGDLKVTLTHPGGTSVVLLSQAGSQCPRDDVDALFSDEGETASGMCDLTIPAVNETVRPAAALSALRGLPRDGEWSLTVHDQANGGAGVLDSWALELMCEMPLVSISATTATAREGGTPGQLTVTRDGLLSSSLRVTYTVGGTAPAGSYTPLSRSVVIPAGSAAATIDVVPSASPNANETVIVTLNEGGEVYLVGAPKSATVTIVPASCGDGVVNEGEECDDGNALDPDACLSTCRLATCGDSIVGPGEECDDGNTVDTDECLPTCKRARCGDGSIGPGEECDDGNALYSDACLPTCKLASCGDGILGQGEECDDGNTVDGDRCSNGCRVPATPEADGCGCNAGGDAPTTLALFGMVWVLAGLARRRRVSPARG
ncbi:MAG: DUF4215 domain-containing protein [Deltaproteobacteria bacterium]|nr:DUF4215 domain-containing protein [Deltaproteobacteria bacterium]